MKKLHKPGLIWITGFSASGKTTVARELVKTLRNDFSNVIHFDGDDLRNIFLGDSVSKIFEAYGYKAHKVQIINDRGIHICKSMVAWKNFSNGNLNKSFSSKRISGS